MLYNTLDLIEKLKSLKLKYSQEGFELLGIFGSYARNEANANSDIDILYKISNTAEYLEKYSGWSAINHIIDVKQQLKDDLDTDIDFVDIESLNNIGKKYILSDVIYV